MKTVEEKAKAYDEVLNKLRHFITKGVDPLITRADVQDFFPELAESEDEKVRKDLIGFFRDGGFLYHKKEEIVDWLEKQGDYANFRDKAQVGDRITKNEDGVLVNLSQLKRVAKPSEKQGKQKFEMKTAEESLGIDSDTYNKIVDECIFGEKKQEWSVEDEQHIDSLLKRLDALCRIKLERTRFAISEDIDWLKSLKDRVGCEAKCTTTKEWSEEDEINVYNIIHFLEEPSMLENNEPCKKIVIDWLKSLRLQNRWKPSDEQIAQLQIVVDTYGNEGMYDPILTELLFQLKKLKEGKV